MTGLEPFVFVVNSHRVAALRDFPESSNPVLLHLWPDQPSLSRSSAAKTVGLSGVAHSGGSEARRKLP